MEQIDPDILEREALHTQLLIVFLRERDQAKVMLRRLWPMISELREALEPLEKEYGRWATKHYVMEKRIAELKKQILKPSSSGRKKARKQPEMSDEEAQNFLASQSRTEKMRLLAELRAMVED